MSEENDTSSATDQSVKDTGITAGEIGPNEYRCGCCGEVYEKTWTDEEAMAEAEGIFGEMLGDDPAIVCDDCWREMMGLPPATPEAIQ